ncbi:hypothetical protein LWI29_019211 [Acer saccharum]|uniref:Uncharacterized protein n=1 Tax=Acer saccharum TaxID=4024 RepID=A0AA39VXL8_ACESA|nr:hypothetical protein LWI29_019211 [Acer saccharum]
MSCVSPNSAKRPTMTQVVMELNECLAIETGCGEVDDETDLKDSVELVNFNIHSEISPLARLTGPAPTPISSNFVLLHFIYCTSSSSSSSHHRPLPSSSSSSSSTITIINHHLPHHPTNPNPEISLSSTTIISKSLFLHSITSGSDDLLLSSLDLDDLNHLDLARSDLHLALTIWICVHLHSRWSGLVLVLRGGGFGFGDYGGGGGLKGCLGFLGFLG